MTDSQYSGYSPGGAIIQPKPRTTIHQQPPTRLQSPPSLASRINHLKLKDYMNDQEITVLEEKEIVQQQPAVLQRPLAQKPEVAGPASARPLEVAHYINSQFKTPQGPPGESPQSPLPPAKPTGGLVSPSGNTKHPQQIWSRDRNGGLTYTGMFSSDC